MNTFTKFQVRVTKINRYYVGSEFATADVAIDLQLRFVMEHWGLSKSKWLEETEIVNTWKSWQLTGKENYLADRVMSNDIYMYAKQDMDFLPLPHVPCIWQSLCNIYGCTIRNHFSCRYIILNASFVHFNIYLRIEFIIWSCWCSPHLTQHCLHLLVVKVYRIRKYYKHE